MGKKFELVQRVEFIKSACAGKKILHLGCTNYPYTREALDAGVLLHEQLAEGGRLLLIERAGRVGQAVIYRRSGDAVGRRVLFDAQVPVLPGFEAHAGFVF